MEQVDQGREEGAAATSTRVNPEDSTLDARGRPGNTQREIPKRPLVGQDPQPAHYSLCDVTEQCDIIRGSGNSNQPLGSLTPQYHLRGAQGSQAMRS